MQVKIGKADPHSDPSAAKRILVVDDELHIREILTRWLEGEGYCCDQAANGEEAWEQLQQGEYALVLCDIMMPGRRMSGVDLLKMIRKRFPDVAAIMVTAVHDRKTAINALVLGAYGYLTKPFEQNEIIINAANALERRRLVIASRDSERRLEEEVRERTAEVRCREEEIALRLVSACEYRDDETGAHIRRMGKYAELMARELGWSRRLQDAIRVAAPMHDIGKIGVPDEILLKPAKLTEAEFECMKEHAQIGADILSGSTVPVLQMARDIALSHHEKWDGSGYPHGLAGGAIPACARLVAIADVYDALSHARVYRPALPEEGVLATMTEGNGKHFDPRMFECFQGTLPEFRRIRQQLADDEVAARLHVARRLAG